MTTLWETGDIVQAVTKAKTLGAIFVVFIEGTNEISTHYNELFRNNDIENKLKSKHFVAIKIQANSTAHEQFSAIYPQTTVPAIFFIGKNGKPLEIITEEMDINNFNSKINLVLEKDGVDVSGGGGSKSMIQKEQLSSIPDADIPTTSGIKDAVEKIQDLNKTPSVVLKSSSSTLDSTTAVEQLTESHTGLSPEDKIKHAQQLLEQKREEKRKEEEEAERLKEIERRKMGQNVQQMKKWQQDEDLKQLKEEREKDKKESREARERVLAQIAQDKAERAAKFSNVVTPPPQQHTPNDPQTSRPSPNQRRARLQFRLPDGTSKTQEFENNDSLETVHEYVRQNLNLTFPNYTLSTTFPRREFTTNDNSQTLVDLQLAPTAVILVLPVNQGTLVTTSNGLVSGLFWWIFAPLFNLLDYVRNYFLGTQQPVDGTTESTSNKRTNPEVDENERKQPKKRAGETTVVKRQGNVHRLTDRPDSDDENNTWNGNSTQQM